MSFPSPTENHQSDFQSHNNKNSASLPASEPISKDTLAGQDQSQDAPPESAFQETLSSSIPLAGGLGISDFSHEAEIPYPEAESDTLLPPPDFKPFFTLIEDAKTGDYQHPTVHYLFADDDQEILTAAALETLSDEHQEERFVIVDISSDGKEVVSASSLSPAWQRLETKVTQAPSWGDESKTGDRGLMLRISGQEAEIWVNGKRKGDIDGLLRAFDQLTSTLDGVFDSKGVNTIA